MAMRARVRTDATGNITVYMEGGLEYENSIPFREQLENLGRQNPTSTITLDMDGIEFVGSSGINLFVDTLRILNKKKQQFLLSNVKNEFLHVFKLYEFDALELIYNHFDNDETEDLAQIFSGRSKTFEN